MRKFKYPAIVWRITVVILFALSLVFTVSYYAPIQVNKSIAVFSENGYSSEVQLNLSLHRSFFSPTVVRGKIKFNGVEYVDWVVDDLSNDSIWERFVRKWNRNINAAVFVNASNFGKSQVILLSDLVYINQIAFDEQYSVEHISFLQTIRDGIVWNSQTQGA